MKRVFFVFAAVALLSAGLWSCGKEDDNNDSASSGGGGQAEVVWVDLGLPSGLLWADRNVGASSSESYGNYYAWGETATKSIYNWSTYAYGSGENQLTKYCSNASYGLNGFTDTLTILQPGDDAATANMGNGARTPTRAEWQELITHTTSTWVYQNGVNGRRFTASNGNSIFLPAAGNRWDDELCYVGSYGYYWFSSLYLGRPFRAWGFYFYSREQSMNNSYGRNDGFSVRAVRHN